jgi:hypothetical protein
MDDNPLCLSLLGLKTPLAIIPMDGDRVRSELQVGASNRSLRRGQIYLFLLRILSACGDLMYSSTIIFQR